MSEQPIWLIIDGNNQVHSTAHGTRGDCNATPRYVTSRIERLVNWIQPANVITTWDSGRTFRSDLLPTYKSGRTKLPGIEQAIGITQRMLRDKGHRVFGADGFEADDIIATVVKDAIESGSNAVIYSADKDLHQLLTRDRVSQLLRVSFRDNHSEFDWMTAGLLFTETGVTPSQWVDYRCLVGDESDRVKGVPLIGAKTAAQILAACHTIDGFYDEPFRAPITKRQHAQMMGARDRIPVLREIFTLRRDALIEQPAGATS